MFENKVAVVTGGAKGIGRAIAQEFRKAAAKGGISALTHALAVSFSGKVRVNAISPGWIDGGMTRQMIYRNDFGWTLQGGEKG